MTGEWRDKLRPPSVEGGLAAGRRRGWGGMTTFYHFQESLTTIYAKFYPILVGERGIRTAVEVRGRLRSCQHFGGGN